jgi:NAD(P)-dependent dehydrogenase (short-subunit alcohol dehydrogenase family)
MPDDFSGRVAIITGAGKGLGRAYALHLAARGAQVLVNNRRHAGESDAQTSAAQVVASIRAQGGRALANHDDVSAEGAGQRLVQQALDGFGRLDIVIANAALAQELSFHKASLAQLRAVIDVGLLGTLQLFHAAWPVLRAQRYGRLVATSSSAGRFGNHGLSAYAASKGAVEMLMRSLAAEGQGHNIRCNAISPYALSQMTEKHLPAPLARVLAPQAVAPMVAWLASEACSANGEVIVAGAGRYARAYGVETASLAGSDMAAVLEQLRALPGQPHTSSSQAFTAFMG